MTGIARTAAPVPVGKAIDRRHAKLGVGEGRLPAAVVTALNPTERAWWEHLGFDPFYPEDPSELDLNLLTSDIEATLDNTR